MSTIGRGNILSEILKCFLLPDPLREDPIVRQLVDHCIVLTTQSPLRFTDSNFSLAKELVVEYAASSFGDELFTEAILLFLQMQHSPDFRKLIWEDLKENLALIRPHSASRGGSDEKCFLGPREQDSATLQAIVNALVGPSGDVSSWTKKNPFLYRLALHHLNEAFLPPPTNRPPVLSPWMEKQLFVQLPKVIPVYYCHCLTLIFIRSFCWIYNPAILNAGPRDNHSQLNEEELGTSKEEAAGNFGLPNRSLNLH